MEAGEMAPSVKCSLCQREDLSLSFSNHLKTTTTTTKQGAAAPTATLVLGRQTGGRIHRALQPVSLTDADAVSSRLNVRSCLKNKVEIYRGRYWILDLKPLHAHTLIYMYTHTHA